ncbi:hypothetical protein C2845_PM08G16030 [Panicum miliaceum]|uniref:Uncharacterized protein n=1 Tax=Panicum miliaceum TaxID=4540 RepID=A0A3L6QWU9_PANMI|nr:hypothetical protein C2845_PM08G16030 [Panicum miliaceum]
MAPHEAVSFVRGRRLGASARPSSPASSRFAAASTPLLEEGLSRRPRISGHQRFRPHQPRSAMSRSASADPASSPTAPTSSASATARGTLPAPLRRGRQQHAPAPSVPRRQVDKRGAVASLDAGTAAEERGQHVAWPTELMDLSARAYGWR